MSFGRHTEQQKKERREIRRTLAAFYAIPPFGGISLMLKEDIEKMYGKTIVELCRMSGFQVVLEDWQETRERFAKKHGLNSKESS